MGEIQKTSARNKLTEKNKFEMERERERERESEREMARCQQAHRQFDLRVKPARALHV